MTYQEEDKEISSTVVKIVIAAFLLVGVLAAMGCDLQVGDGNVQTKISGPSALPTPSASPVPSPSVSPTATPESCIADYLILRPQDVLVLVNNVGRASLTSYRSVTNPDGTVAQVEISAACNNPKTTSIRWVSTSASVKIGSGWEPLVTRTGLGEAFISAQLEGKVSNVVAVR